MLSFFCFFFLFNSRGCEGGVPDFYQIKFHGRNFKKVVFTWAVSVAPNLPLVWQLQLLQLGSAPSSHPFQRRPSLPRPRNHFSFSWFQRVSRPTVIFVLHCRHSLLIHNCGLVPATNGRGSVLQPVERVVATTGGCAASNFPQQPAANQLIPSFPSSLHFPSQPTFSSGNTPTISAKTETEGGITGNYFQRRAQAPRPQDSARSKGETDLNFEI